jgi:hypothetical protein
MITGGFCSFSFHGLRRPARLTTPRRCMRPAMRLRVDLNPQGARRHDASTPCSHDATPTTAWHASVTASPAAPDCRSEVAGKAERHTLLAPRPGCMSPAEARAYMESLEVRCSDPTKESTTAADARLLSFVLGCAYRRGAGVGLSDGVYRRSSNAM